MSVYGCVEPKEYSLDFFIPPCYEFIDDYDDEGKRILKERKTTRECKNGEIISTSFYHIKLKDMILMRKSILKQYSKDSNDANALEKVIKTLTKQMKKVKKEEEYKLNNFLLSLRSSCLIK